MFLFFSTVKWACLCDKLKLRTIWSHVISCRCIGQVNPSVVSILGFCLLVGTVPDLSSVVQFWACAEWGSLCVSNCANSPKGNREGCFFPTFYSWLQNGLAYQLVCEQKPFHHGGRWWNSFRLSWIGPRKKIFLCPHSVILVLFYKFKG